MEKLALITGASRGIGAALARRLAKEGSTIILTGRSLQSPSHAKLDGTLNDVASEIRRRGGRAFSYELDVANPVQIREIAEMVEGKHGGLDLLVNNASAIDVRPDVPIKHVDLMHDVNSRGTMLMNRSFLPLLKRRSGQIVTISPPLENHTRWLSLALPYSLSKYGMTLSTIGVSLDIKANCLWPKRTISTAATRMLEEQTNVPYYSRGRDVEYFVDAALKLVDTDISGKTLLDEDLVANADVAAPLDMFVDDES